MDSPSTQPDEANNRTGTARLADGEEGADTSMGSAEAQDQDDLDETDIEPQPETMLPELLELLGNEGDTPSLVRTRPNDTPQPAEPVEQAEVCEAWGQTVTIAQAVGGQRSRYPIVLVHGFMGWDEVLWVEYFYDIPESSRSRLHRICTDHRPDK